MTRMGPLPVKNWPPEMRDALAAMTPPGHPRSLTGERYCARGVHSAKAHRFGSLRRVWAA